MIRLRSIALLMAIMSCSLIAFSQTSSAQDSVKCFTHEQAREIAKAIKHGEICDSISQNQELQIINFREIVIKDDDQIILMKEQEEKLQGELNTTRLKLKATATIAKYGIPGGIAVGLLVGILVAK